MQVFRKMSRNILKNFETMKNDGVECHRPARVSTASKKYLFFFKFFGKVVAISAWVTFPSHLKKKLHSILLRF